MVLTLCLPGGEWLGRAEDGVEYIEPEDALYLSERDAKIARYLAAEEDATQARAWADKLREELEPRLTKTTDELHADREAMEKRANESSFKGVNR